MLHDKLGVEDMIGRLVDYKNLLAVLRISKTSKELVFVLIRYLALEYMVGNNYVRT